MGKIALYINSAKKNSFGFAPIYFRITLNGKRFTIPLNITVPPGSISGNYVKGFADAKQVNRLIDSRRGDLSKIMQALELSGNLTKENIINAYKDKAKAKTQPAPGKPTKTSGFTFVELMELYREKNKGRYSVNYLNSFKPAVDILIKYTGNPELKPAAIDENVLNDCVKFMIEAEKPDGSPKYLNNTIATHMRRLKTLNKFARILGEPVNDLSGVTVSYEKINPVFLSWDEVQAIDSLNDNDLSTIEILTRNEFIFRCYTGIREGDIKHLTKANFVKTPDGFELNFNFEKQRKAHTMAIATRAAEIAEKYNFKFPVLDSTSKNRIIKRIAKLASITNQIEVTRTRGSELIRNVKPKFNFITTHTARRTFGRRWIEKGGDIIQLCKILGHSNPEITLQYIGYESKEINKAVRGIFG